MYALLGSSRRSIVAWVIYGAAASCMRRHMVADRNGSLQSLSAPFLASFVGCRGKYIYTLRLGLLFPIGRKFLTCRRRCHNCPYIPCDFQKDYHASSSYSENGNACGQTGRDTCMHASKHELWRPRRRGEMRGRDHTLTFHRSLERRQCRDLIRTYVSTWRRRSGISGAAHLAQPSKLIIEPLATD